MIEAEREGTGMSLFRTLAMLTTAALVVFFFYCIGYALVEHHMRPVLVGIGSLIGAAVLLFLQVRVGRRA
jgi:hypothetical protein